MGSRVVRGGFAVLVACALCALLAAVAAAQPASGPRENVDQSFTSKRPGTPTGLSYSGRYHAAGNSKGNPPYMRRMVFYPPRGFRYDTSVPARCTASDVELEARGAAACPTDSRLGRGTTEGLFFYPFDHSLVFDHYKHTVDILNNANEQIILVNSEGSTVVRGHVRPDSSVEFRSPTCFPAPPAGGCADDYILQLASTTVMPPYKKISHGRVRGYATTPPRCPSRGYWTTTVRFWWSNGAVDSVATRQPCAPPRKRSSRS